MAPELAPRGPNESAKEARERRQAEMVKAWIEWDDKQAAAQAQIDALNAQGGLTQEQEAARKENQEKVAQAATKKQSIEDLWRSEFNCPFKKGLAQIEGSAEVKQTENLVEASNRPPEEAGKSAREQVQDLKATTLLHATQTLLKYKLLPQDLRGGENQKRAAGLVRPDLAAELPSEEANAELSAYADQIQPIYDRQKLGYEAARDMEKGVVVGKAGETLKEAISNPSRLGAGFAAIVGVGLLYHVFKGNSPSEGLTKWALGILGVGAVVGGGYMAVRGLDVLNTATGIRMDEPLASPAMKEVRKALEARMGTKDSGVIDNMIRVYDSPIENYMEAYLSALRGHSDGIQKERLSGNNGLSDDEMVDANNQFIKKGGDWLSMQCYEMALKDGKTPALTDIDAQRAAGAQYAKTEFAGLTVGSILVAIDMVAAGVGLKPAVSESRPGNPHLRELESKDKAFADVLEPTDQADIYLIYGYPVRYTYTDTGDHVFTSVLSGGPEFVRVEKRLTGGGLSSTLLRISTEAEEAARTLYATAALVGEDPDPESTADEEMAEGRVKYNENGDWILDPPLARATHAGLAHYLTGPNDPKVPVILYYDTAEKKVRIGMDSNGDGVPEKRATPYHTVNEVAEEFEKTILHDRIVSDTSSTLLVPFTVESYKDEGTTTEVHITYGDGAKGKMIYEADKIKEYKLDPEAELQAKWTEHANEVCKTRILGDPRVQDALLRATTAYTGDNLKLMAGLVSKFIGLAKSGIDWFANDSLQNEFANNWERQVVKKMTDLLYDPVNGLSATYVKEMFSGAGITTTPHAPYSNTDFGGMEDEFVNKQVASIAGGDVVMATVIPEELPDQVLRPGQAMQMAHNTEEGGGTYMIRAALEPLKSQTPAHVPGLFNSAWQGLKNSITNDSARTAAYEEQVGKFQIELDEAIAAYTAIPAGPNPPPGSPGLRTVPTQATRRQVETEIARIQAKAQAFALSYTGLNNSEAINQLLLSPAEEAQPEWKAASEKVVSYVTNNMKWEKWAVMPNPENMMLVLDLWYERVGEADLNGKKTGHGAIAGHPAQFADYFIYEMQLRLGGHQDYSVEYLYGNVQSVSDTNFKGTITSLRSSVKPYTVWKDDPILHPNSPDMPPTAELERRRMVEYRETKKAEFEAWFAKHGDVGGLFKLDHYWPQVFTQSVNDRLIQIITDPFATQASLNQNIDDFKAFVWNERYIIFESLILNRVEADHKGYNIRVHILNQMLSYFYQVPRDLAGYQRHMKEQMRLIMGSQHTFPNMPGVPFA